MIQVKLKCSLESGIYVLIFSANFLFVFLIIRKLLTYLPIINTYIYIMRYWSNLNDKMMWPNLSCDGKIDTQNHKARISS